MTTSLASSLLPASCHLPLASSTSWAPSSGATAKKASPLATSVLTDPSQRTGSPSLATMLALPHPSGTKRDAASLPPCFGRRVMPVRPSIVPLSADHSKLTKILSVTKSSPTAPARSRQEYSVLLQPCIPCIPGAAAIIRRRTCRAFKCNMAHWIGKEVALAAFGKSFALFMVYLKYPTLQLCYRHCKFRSNFIFHNFHRSLLSYRSLSAGVSRPDQRPKLQQAST